MSITIVDYDAGNLRSVEKALAFLGAETRIERDPEKVRSAEKLILPGVGAFGLAMEQLRSFGLDDALRDAVAKGTPLLGICLGMQLLFEESEESPGAAGLGILPGKVLHFPASDGLKIPHMGWNSLKVRPDSRLLAGLPEDPYVYFVHSYYLKADRREDVAAQSEYGLVFDAAAEREQVFGCQFHPEKSSRTGLAILKNFISL